MQAKPSSQDTDAQDLVKVRQLVASGEAKRLRENAPLSLTEMANATQVDPSTIWRWETQRRRPRGSAASRYARMLELLASLEGS